ncbi:MAG: flagellar FlbD family protein [Bacillota bacterium]|jgi:flagellar protein FlbD|nr:flagellar FlbD family protein [Clostridia bacterium]
MIYLTRLNGKQLVLNSDLIEIMEDTPDTVLTLTNERKYVVRESLDEIIERIIEYKKKCNLPLREEENS